MKKLAFLLLVFLFQLSSYAQGEKAPLYETKNLIGIWVLGVKIVNWKLLDFINY
jgi:hypothetical protein